MRTAKKAVGKRKRGFSFEYWVNIVESIKDRQCPLFPYGLYARQEFARDDNWFIRHSGFRRIACIRVLIQGREGDGLKKGREKPQ
jgi:hypothetical protein